LSSRSPIKKIRGGIEKYFGNGGGGEGEKFAYCPFCKNLESYSAAAICIAKYDIYCTQYRIDVHEIYKPVPRECTY
jgi:hypothetical protein